MEAMTHGWSDREELTGDMANPEHWSMWPLATSVDFFPVEDFIVTEPDEPIIVEGK